MPSSDRRSNEDIDSLVDHLRSIEGVDSDIAVKIAENWQRLLGVMAMILLGVWLFGSYQSRQAAKSENASNLFVEAQGAYRGMPVSAAAEEAESKAVTDAIAKIDASLRLVAESYPESVYRELAPLYDALAKAKAGEMQQALSQLAPMAEQTKSIGKYSAQAGLSRERFVNELAALVYAKLLIESGERAAEARELLSYLTKNSAVVAAESAVTLLRISKTDAEIGEALTAARELMDIRPELGAIVARELQSQGLEAPLRSEAEVVRPVG